MRTETASTKRKISHAFLFVMALLLFPSITYAIMVTYTRDYRYQASEADSKLSSRTIALEQVKRLLLEELGTYVISVTEVKDFAVTKDKIITFTAGIVSTIVLEEKWDGLTYYLKAEISADTDDLIKAIDRVHKDPEQSMPLEAIRKRTEEALKEIDDLKKEMGKGKVGKATQEKYADAVNILNAMDWVKKGNSLVINDFRLKEGMQAYDKAIELDPNLAVAYSGRASIYIEWEFWQKAIRESGQAIKLDPNLALAFNWRGAAHIGMEEYKTGLEDLNRATVLRPSWATPYRNRSWAYWKMGKNNEALAEANKAIDLAQNSNHFALGHFCKGRVLVELGKFNEAIESFNKAIEYNPNFPRFYFFRGKAFLGINEKERGLEDITKAARLGHKGAQRYLDSRGIR